MLHNELTMQDPHSPAYHSRHPTTHSSSPSLGSPPNSLPRRPPRGSVELLADPEDVDIGPFRKSSDDDEFQLMVLGKSGEGKSSLLNAILGEDAFRAKMSVSEVTKMVESHCGRWLGHPEYTAVKCVDTPSFAGQLADRTRVAQIRNFLDECMNGVDAFLVVIKVTHYRYDASIQATLKVYETILTPSFWQNAILVFSHADPETAPTWSDSQPYFEDFAKQIAKQFHLSQPPPICFASDKRSFGKCSTNIRNMGANGEIVVHEGARFFTIEPPAQTLYQHIKKLHSRPYFPTHLTAFLRTHQGVTPLEFVDQLMVAIERLEGFREIDRGTMQRRLARDDSAASRLSHSVGPYNLGNQSIAASIGSAHSASNMLSSWSRSIPPLMSDDERPRRRAVSAQPSPTEPVEPAIGSFGGRIGISAMAGLLQLPMLRRSSSAVGVSARALRRSNTIGVPVSTSVGLGGGSGLSKFVNIGRRSWGDIAT